MHTHTQTQRHTHPMYQYSVSNRIRPHVGIRRYYEISSYVFDSFLIPILMMIMMTNDLETFTSFTGIESKRINNVLCVNSIVNLNVIKGRG